MNTAFKQARLPGSYNQTWQQPVFGDAFSNDLAIQQTAKDGPTTYPWPGIEITQWRATFISEKDGTFKTVDIHAAVIDLTSKGMRLRFTKSGGTRDVVRQTTKDFVDQENAVFGVNCMFFQPYPSTDLNTNVMGFAASEGAVISRFCAQPPNEPGGPYDNQGYAIVDYAPAINIDPDNFASIVHYDPADMNKESVLEDIIIWTAFSGSAQIITNGYVTIPKYAPLGPLQNDLPTFLPPASRYSNTNSWYDLLRARSGSGISQDGRKLIFVTGDQYSESVGMTVTELAQVMLRFGAYNAINSDGGGSSSMVLRSPFDGTSVYINAPSNGWPRENGGNLAVYFPG